MKNKAFAAAVSFVLVAAMAVPGTMALSADTDSSPESAAAEVLTASEAASEAAEEASASEGTSASSETPASEAVSDGNEQSAEEAAPQNEEETPASSEPEQEKAADDAAECTCGAAEGEAHKEGCPLYTAPEKSLYERLMAAETADEFEAIAERASEEKFDALTCEELDDADARYIFLTTGEYPDFSPVVDEVMEIVDYTYVAPFGEPVTGGRS